MQMDKFEPIYFTTPNGLGYSRTLWKDSPSPPAAPPVPDPSVQVQAQARAMPSAYTPSGSRVFSGNPDDGTFGYTETYAPSQQRQFDARNRIAEQLGARAEYQLPKIPGDPFKFQGATDPTTNAYFQAQKGLLDQSFGREDERLDQKLVNQGIPMGSEAYREQMDDQSRRKADAYTQASAAALDKGYGQALGTRQQNYNELASLLGGQQLQPVSGGGGGGLDVASAFANQQAGQNRAYQGALAGYNADVAGNNSTMGGLFSLGASALPFILSDVRLKRDIYRIGETPGGVPVYLFRYLWADEFHVGVMAQEAPAEAVHVHPSGYLMVDYSKVH